MGFEKQSQQSIEAGFLIRARHQVKESNTSPWCWAMVLKTVQSNFSYALAFRVFLLLQPLVETGARLSDGWAGFSSQILKRGDGRWVASASLNISSLLIYD